MQGQMPQEPAAERAVLGAVYLDANLYYSLSKQISADDFYDRRNRELWRAIGVCAERGRFDLVTLEAVLKERKSLEAVGGMGYFVEVVNETPTSYGAHEYAAIVEDRGRRRRLMQGYAQAYQQLSDVSQDISGINAFVQQSIIVPEADSSKTYDFQAAFDVFSQAYKAQEHRGAEMPGISTGYPKLDKLLGGLEDGKMYVIGGRPAMGKTALALNMAYEMARRGETVAYFSLEMKVNEVIKRLISIGTGIPGQKIKTAKLTETDKEKVKAVRGAVSKTGLIINDRSSQTMQGIMSECIGINAGLDQEGKRIRCIMIDHMQLLSSQLKSADRRVQIGEASRACKILADALNCPVVILSQLSRALRDRKDNRPILTDLRESGDIEQDADAVIFLHREGYYTPETADQDAAEVIVAKNRDGQTAKIDYDWDAECTQFREIISGRKWGETA